MAELLSLNEFTTFVDKFKQILDQLSSIPTGASEQLNQYREEMGIFLEQLGLVLREFDSRSFLGDSWLLSTFARITKVATQRLSESLFDQIKPIIPISRSQLVSIIPANKIAKVLLSLRKNPKLQQIVAHLNARKRQEYKLKLESELLKAPEETSPDEIQEFKTYFANTQEGWEEFQNFQQKKLREDKEQRKLETHRARLKEQRAKEKSKQQLQEFEDTGGYESIEVDQIERVRKKALVPQKRGKRAKFSPEIEEKIEQRKLKEQQQSDSEDRAQKFFQEKQKMQQEYIEKLKKMQKKRKE